jgi:hypothetical protein
MLENVTKSLVLQYFVYIYISLPGGSIPATWRLDLVLKPSPSAPGRYEPKEASVSAVFEHVLLFNQRWGAFLVEASIPRQYYLRWPLVTSSRRVKRNASFGSPI